jgi:hypothetical protein
MMFSLTTVHNHQSKGLWTETWNHESKWILLPFRYFDIETKVWTTDCWFTLTLKYDITSPWTVLQYCIGYLSYMYDISESSS